MSIRTNAGFCTECFGYRQNLGDVLGCQGIKCAAIPIRGFDCLYGGLSLSREVNTPVSQLQTRQVMTSLIRSHM